MEDIKFFETITKLGYKPKIIYDIGSSIGCWSETISNITENCSFYMFEPLLDFVDHYKNSDLNKEIIKNNNPLIIKNNNSFYLFNLALGEKRGNMTMKVFPDGYSSTSLDSYIGGEEIKNITTSVYDLDFVIEKDNLPQPQIIKIDTQGSELKILKGATKTLKNVDFLILECWLSRGYGSETPLLKEMMNWLSDFDFHLFDILGEYRGYSDTLATIDCVFMNFNCKILPEWYINK
jgi:FkbM family methyltransferase